VNGHSPLQAVTSRGIRSLHLYKCPALCRQLAAWLAPAPGCPLSFKDAASLQLVWNLLEIVHRSFGLISFQA
jgi:hypothetical protein